MFSKNKISTNNKPSPNSENSTGTDMSSALKQTNEEKNHKILETTSFRKLSKMEDQGLFKENVLNKKDRKKVKFFHLGPKNTWQDNLDKDIVNKLEKSFFTEMKELSYL